jgi:Aerotolerance regulator N-terminal/von Willebrand factor type A domain
VSFLSIAFLAALPLAAAPILLHLFDRRRHVVIEWGAMQFLLEAATRRTSARRLKQWLLLLLRVLAVAALVFAMARPLLPGNWFGNPDRGETVFVLDNSMSMARKTGDVSLFETAINRAVAELDDVEAGDFVRVLQASPYPIWATPGSVRVDADTSAILADRLRELRSTNGRSDLLSALFTAVQAEVQPAQKQRRIVLLTDRQRSDWSLDDEAGWKRLREVLHSAPVPTYLEVVDLNAADDDAGNIAIDHVHSNRTVVGIDEPFTLTARIRNYGRAMTTTSPVVWTIGKDELQESLCPALAEGQSQDVVWKHSFSETGVYSISCRVDADDELAPDNRATVVVEVVDSVPVFVVESAPNLAETQRDGFFVEAALGWIDGEPLAAKGVQEPTVVAPEDLARFDVTDPRAVIIPNLQSIDEEAARLLEEFVLNGGGLWIALGPRTDVEAYNQLLFADGNGLAPLAVDDMTDEEQRTTIDPFATEHPANSELADHDRLDLADVSISRRFRFVPPPEGEPVSELLSLSNGEPLAVEKYFGRGRVIVQSIPLRLQWSELARSQAFVVMVRDWLDYLTQPRATRYNLSPGDPISIHFADADMREATLSTPQGDEIELTADTASDGVVFRSSRTILPGDYSLTIGLSGDIIPFHVNRDPLESSLTPLTAADREMLDDLAGLSQSIASAALSGTSQNEPLWPTLLIILIAVMAAELLLSGMIARERFGSDPISESSELVASMAATSSPFGDAPTLVTGGARGPQRHAVVHTKQKQEESVESFVR